MPKKLIYLFCLLLGGFTVVIYSSCYPNPVVEEPDTSTSLDTVLEKAAVEINRRPSEQYDYYLQWGDLQMPVEKYANPNGYKGEVTLDIEMLKTILNQPVKLLKTSTNKALDIEIHTVNKYANQWRGPQWFPDPATEKSSQLDTNIAKSIHDNLQKGDQVNLSLSSTNKEVYVSQALIKVKDPFAAYQPEIKVTRPKSSETPFGFQVISQDEKQVLRIDTNNVDTKHILELYAERPNYKILHIPNFQTHRRLLIKEDDLFPKKSIRYSELIDNEFDAWTLSEYSDFHQKKVKLEWGEMTSWLSSKNYPLDTFQISYTAPLELFVEDEKIPIAGFDLVIKNGEKSPIRFITTNLKQESILKKLATVGAKSTIYFDNIIVRNGENDFLHFPIDFAFNIDETTDYRLTIDEIDTTATITSPTHWTGYRDSMHQIQYSHYRLSDLVVDFLGLSKEEIWLHGFDNDPLLEICYFSKDFPIEYGREAIFRALQERYKIHPYWRSWQKMYALSVIQSDFIETYRYPDEESENSWKFSKSFNEESEEMNMTYANFYRVAWEFSREFKMLVINDTFMEGLYQFRLDYSSLENLQAQLLSEYGLELVQLDEQLLVVVEQY